MTVGQMAAARQKITDKHVGNKTENSVIPGCFIFSDDGYRTKRQFIVNSINACFKNPGNGQWICLPGTGSEKKILPDTDIA